MKISKIELVNFKRFTHLVIDKIPSDAKLVLLIGANGSGKSGVFDAFDCVSKGLENSYEYFMESAQYLIDYYRKDDNKEVNLKLLFDNGQETVIANLNPNTKSNQVGKFIGRSSIRIIPRLTNTANVEAIKINADSPATFIDNDTRFVNDVSAYTQAINEALRESFFQGVKTDTAQLFQEFIQPLNSALKKIFDTSDNTELNLVAFKDATPQNPPQLIFQKGGSRINYDLLSHGEKQVVILLLNFIVRKKYYEDAIIFIDEMDSHLNTALQERLLEEIVTRWIPDSSQLWTASHALGFISYANKSKEAAIIDFDLLDFDVKQTLLPSEKESLDLFEIAVPRASLFKIMEGKKIVVCENKNDEYYNLLGLPNTIFGGVKDSRDVFLYVKNDPNYYSLRDRDFISDTEMERIHAKYPHHCILRYYDFENYLYHPDNIAELNPAGFDKEAYTAEIKRQKEERYKYISPTIVSSRQSYEEFKTDEKLRDKDTDSIVDDFSSEEFERFYKFFDMKQQFNKSYLAAFNLSKENLVKTSWFRNRIAEILLQ